MCRPRAYVFSDCHSHVLEQLQGNVLLNGLSLEPNVTALAQHPGHDTADAESPRVTVAQVDWDVVTAPQLAAFQPDIVIAAGTAQLRPLECGLPEAPPGFQCWEGDGERCLVGGMMGFGSCGPPG